MFKIFLDKNIDILNLPKHLIRDDYAREDMHLKLIHSIDRISFDNSLDVDRLFDHINLFTVEDTRLIIDY